MKVIDLKETMYTAGEIARSSGISIRTIRFYDEKGLLKPAGYSKSGYRLYNKESAEELQKILMLKYLGFSLDTISAIIKNNEKEELKESLKKQKKLLQKKQEHIKHIIDAVEKLEKSNEGTEWDNIMNVIGLLTEREDIMNQYSNDVNLQKRINIHDKYSINKYGWHKWEFDKLNIKENMRILEIGCGNGMLWKTNKDRIPNNVTLILTDYSDGMLENAKENILKDNEKYFKDKNISFEFETADADNFTIDQGEFDIVLADHMLYYVKERQALFCKIKNILKDNGRFICATVGENHMLELRNLAIQFDNNLNLSHEAVSDAFSLENGEKQLMTVFKNVQNINYEDSLIVDNCKAIYDYIYSVWGNTKSIIDNTKKSLMDFIEKKLKKGPLYVTKCTGIFICTK